MTNHRQRPNYEAWAAVAAVLVSVAFAVFSIIYQGGATSQIIKDQGEAIQELKQSIKDEDNRLNQLILDNSRFRQAMFKLRPQSPQKLNVLRSILKGGAEAATEPK